MIVLRNHSRFFSGRRGFLYCVPIFDTEACTTKHTNSRQSYCQNGIHMQKKCKSTETVKNKNSVSFLSFTTSVSAWTLLFSQSFWRSLKQEHTGF